MTKKATLPEHVIDKSESALAKRAKDALNAREKVNQFTTKEKEHKEGLAEDCELLRRGKAAKDVIIGKVSIAPPNQAAVRVEFRINNGSMDADQMEELDRVFGTARPDLFELVKIVDDIPDPDALIKSLREAGLDPWDYLDIGVKKNQDQIIIDKGDGITTDEAILPKKGLLAVLPDLIKNFTVEAKDYINKYLNLALKPTVVLGTKVKK